MTNLEKALVERVEKLEKDFDLLFDHLPPVFRDDAKKLVLSQYEKKSDVPNLRKLADELKRKGEKFNG